MTDRLLEELGPAVPRWGTRRNPDRPTDGLEVEAIHLLLGGSPFMPHQRLITDVFHELDPDTGLYWYDVCVLVIPRQEGKTTVVESVLIRRARRQRDADVVYTAQDRQMSRRRLIDELYDRRLSRSRPFAGLVKARRSNGSESIRFLQNGSQITTVANTDTAGHGLTIPLAVLDEAFAHDDMTVVNALEPTMITLPDPQLWVVSTVGDGTDGLLQHYQDIGLASLADPSTRVAYFEWSALPDDDRQDPAVWARVMPALGRTITVDRIRARATTLPPDVFDRAYLCRRPKASAETTLPQWAACRRDDVWPSAPYTLAAAVAVDRKHASLAVVGRSSTDPTRLALVVDRRPGVSWLAAELAAQAARLRPVRTVADRRAGAGTIIDSARALGVHVTELDAADVTTYSGTLEDLVADLELEHPGHPDLDQAADLAVPRPLGGARTWSAHQSPVDISPLLAAASAAGAHRELYPRGSRAPSIH